MWDKIRYWLIGILFNKNEKYLIRRALNERIEYLHKYKIEEKTADYDTVCDDIRILEKCKAPFFISHHENW